MPEPRTLTLITGDRVAVGGPGEVSAQPGPGRTGVTFAITTSAAGVTVVPSDAGPLLAAGRLDKRLFNVTRLLEFGYDKRPDLPLIVTGSTGATVAGLTKQRALPAVNGTAVRQPRNTAAQAWRTLTGGTAKPRTLRSDVDKIWLDGMLKPTVDVSVPQIGAPEAWAAGFTGEGTTVAVLDTGIDDSHPDLAGRVTARSNFTEGAEPDGDLDGHGTHVASTAAGRHGVAPGATLLDGKVCVQGGCAESWIIAGMTWAAAEQHAKLVNLSLGAPDDPGVVDPVEAAVQELTDRYGTLFVVAAGNADGITDGAIDSPGTAPAAITVGAVDDHDVLAAFSRRGPGPHGTLKPDITAPGVNITAAAPGGGTATLSGTSMATPHVAGAAAILSQQHPDWTGEQLKAALMASAHSLAAGTVYAQGAGRMDVARAARQMVTSRTPSVGFDEQKWPHDEDPVQTREVTYHNSGGSAVTLSLTAPTGGVFSTDRDTVVVPAGGDATVTVTADTRVSGPDGLLGGWLVATTGETVVRTPVGVHKEVESYDVTFVHRDRAGAVPQSFATMVSRRDSLFQTGWFGPDPGNSFTVRLPKAHYSVHSDIVGSGSTLLARPDLYVDRTLTVELDAAKAKPVSVTLPRPSATQIYAQLSAYTTRPGGAAGMTIGGSSFDQLYLGRIGPDVPDDAFLTLVGGQWTRGTDLYALLFPLRGRMVTGFRRVVAQRELATVHAEYAAGAPGTTGGQQMNTSYRDDLFQVGGFGPMTPFTLPSTRTEYYNADPGIGSRGIFRELQGDEIVRMITAMDRAEYRAGRTYPERWNTAVTGPVLPGTDLFWNGATRTGDAMRFDLPLFGDGAGRAGDGITQSRETRLFRDGEPVPDDEGSFAVPPGEASYRLVMSAVRGAPYVLSTRIDLAWTFRSGHAAATSPLPLWTVRFTPPVDDRGAAPAGRAVKVPMVASAQRGSQPGRVTRTTVEASFDDGASWTAVPVKDGAALIRHPGNSGFVSLRATVTDDAGNTAEQTVLRAYRYTS